MASTSVVLPWSTCAMIATLRMSVRSGIVLSRVARAGADLRRRAFVGLAAVAVATAVCGGGAAAAGPRTLSIAWVGDMALSSHYGLPPGGAGAALSHVRGQLRSTDLTFGNLEGTLGAGGSSKCGGGSTNCFAFQAPASYAGAYRRAGFDVMNVANNHALDFGPFGQRQTLAALHRHHIGHTGRPGQILV